MKLNYQAIESTFKDTFTISNGRSKTQQPALIVSLSLGNFTGYGEAPAISYYNITVEQMLADLKAKKMFVEKFALTEPERYWHYLHHLFPQNPFLVSALDMACWDLFAQMRGAPLYHLWQTKWENLPLTDYTIGIDTVEKMKEKLIETPWPFYKIKLGTDEDIKIVEALRSCTDKPFRVDVNGGWSLQEAVEKITQLKPLGVTLVEQPLPKEAWEEMATLHQQSVLPLFADESCVAEQDVDKCAQCFDGINIKLTKCSGITPALRMIKNAKAQGLKIMMGSMNETEIGSAAIANFLPQLDYVDMDGPLLLNNHTAEGLQITAGNVVLAQRPGLGVVVTL